jgi:adenylosuccinate lyase
MIARYTRPILGEIWSDEQKLRTWRDVEVALVDVLEAAEIAAPGAGAALRSQPIPTAERVAELERTLDHDVIAFLTALVAGMGAERQWVHYGMTSSDLLDTAQALRVARSLDVIRQDLEAVIGRTRELAERHRRTPCVGRTHGVHAEPTTMGLKFLSWYAELLRQRERLARAAATMRVGKLSGAVGTCAHLSPEIERAFLDRLGLATEPVSTQVVARDRHLELMSVLASIGASIERFGTEIRHLQRTEVREAAEGFGRGQKGSSAMPHKRNPITCERLCGLARVLRAYATAAAEDVALWHERDITHSSVERIILPDGLCLVDYMLDRFGRVLDGLETDPDRMRENLALTHGLVFSGRVLLALTRRLGDREAAYAVVQRHALRCQESGERFADALKADPDVRTHLSAAEIEELFDLDAALRHVDAIFDRTTA